MKLKYVQSSALPLPEGRFSVIRSCDRALEIGKAGEHLVCCDLISQGYRAFLSDQGLPYDVLVDLGSKFLRVQVKTTLAPRELNCKGRQSRIGYSFSARRCGKNGQQRFTDSDCDVVAFVGLDKKIIAYLPVDKVGVTFQVSDRKSTSFKKRKGSMPYIGDFTFDNFINGGFK